MADTQILPLGTEATPAVWTVPDALVVELAAVYATFDGDAAGPYVPTLIVRSDSGHIVGVWPAPLTIDAGRAANVTWSVASTATPAPADLVAHAGQIWTPGAGNPANIAAGIGTLVGLVVDTAALASPVSFKLYDSNTAALNGFIMQVPGPAGLGVFGKLPYRMQEGLTVHVVDSLTGADYAGSDLIQLTAMVNPSL